MILSWLGGSPFRMFENHFQKLNRLHRRLNFGASCAIVHAQSPSQLSSDKQIIYQGQGWQSPVQPYAYTPTPPNKHKQTHLPKHRGLYVTSLIKMSRMLASYITGKTIKYDQKTKWIFLCRNVNF